MDTNFAIVIVWASLMLSTPLGILAVRSDALSSWRNRMVFGCLTLLAFVIWSAFAQISFMSTHANLVAWVGAYMAHGYLAASAWRISHRWVRVAALVTMHIPIAIGYLVGTIGLLGLAFIVADETAPALTTMQLTPNIRCDVRGWGMAATDSGYTIRLRKRLRLFPAAQRTVYSTIVNETQSYTSGEGNDCHSAFAAYRRTAGE